MAVQTWRNLASDPKVVQETGGQSPSWKWNIGHGGAGDAGQMSVATSGGPTADLPSYGYLSPSFPGTISYAYVLYEDVDQSIIGRTVSILIHSYMNRAGSARVHIWGADSTGVARSLFGAPTPSPDSEWFAARAVISIPSDWQAVWSVGVYIEFPEDTFTPDLRGTGLVISPRVDGLDYNGPYFDGDLADVPDVVAYSWDGPADNSPSRAVFAIPEPEAQAAQISAQVVPVPNPVIPRVLKPLYLKDFSVQEDSTPIYASDSTGGAGTMSLSVDENGDTPYLLDAEIDLVDPAQGTTRGTIRNLASDNTQVSISADSRMALLNVTRNAAAVSGILEDALAYYFGLCGITDGFVIEDSIQSIPVKFLGFSGNVLEELKKIGAANGFEINLVSNNIVARPIRQRIAQNYRDSSRSWSYDTSQKAQSVEIYKYTVSEVTNGLIYNGYTENQTPLVVDAGTTAEFTIPFNGSLISIDQPVFTTTIGPGDPGFSAYNASGNDNLPITQAQWEAQGGSLSVSISDDTRSIVVSITAPAETQYSPYRIGVSDGEETYSTLRLHGSALIYEKELHTYNTAVDPDRVSREVGATVDSPYIQTDQQLLDAAMGELRYWGGNRRTINVATRGINRLGDNGSYAYAEFSDFDSWWDNASPGADFGDFDTDAPATFGNTFGEHDEWWIEEVQDDFANQAFGNIAGARVFTDSNVHRIRTATTTPGGITYTAWEDSIFSDHDALWGGATFADFDDHWIGRAFVEFDATPLEPVEWPLGFGLGGFGLGGFGE